MTYILYNPLANGGNGTAGVGKVQAAYQAEKPETLDITKLELREFFSGLTAEDKVILCGGDGTINFLINAIDGVEVLSDLQMWRFGTGNDFLRDVSGKHDSQTVPLNEYIQNLPYAEMQGRRIRFINNCCCGMDGLVCERGEAAKRARKKGRINYTWLALRAILHDYRCVNAKVTVDGETREYEKVWMASVLNGRYIGGGMMLAPNQDRMSDMLCSFVWHGTGRIMTVIRLLRVFGGTHVKYKDMCDIRFGRNIEVELSEPVAVNLDGEVVSGVRRYTAHK